MNIVWVKAGGLLPVNTGGRSRSYHLLKCLAQKHSVSVFTFYAAQPDDPHPLLREPFSRVECLPLAIPAKGTLSDYVRYGLSLLSMQSYSLAKYHRRRVRHRVRRFLEEGCDVIVCDFLFSAPSIPWDVACPKVLFSHNVEAAIWERHFRVANSAIWRAVCWREWRLTEKAERKYARKADAVLTVSETDREAFARLVSTDKISVVPTGVDTQYFRPAAAEEKPNCLVFTGSMDWLANEDAMVHFVRTILPRIQQQVPDVSLCIVGRSPTKQIQELAIHNRNVHVTGTVDDIRPYMNMAQVYIVPLRVGSGTRLKIFEAMASAKAVVSTPIGAEGLPVTHGRNILLPSSDEAFADTVVDLIRDPIRRGNLGLAARNLVETRYSWAAAASILEEALLHSIQTPGRRKSP